MTVSLERELSELRARRKSVVETHTKELDALDQRIRQVRDRIYRHPVDEVLAPLGLRLGKNGSFVQSTMNLIHRDGAVLVVSDTFVRLFMNKGRVDPWPFVRDTLEIVYSSFAPIPPYVVWEDLSEEEEYRRSLEKACHYSYELTKAEKRLARHILEHGHFVQDQESDARRERLELVQECDVKQGQPWPWIARGIVPTHRLEAMDHSPEWMKYVLENS